MTDRKLALELALADVAAELMAARMSWPPFNSAHEGYAVAAEEVDELWQHVKVKQCNRDLDAMRREAIQAAAMFAAFAAECCGEKTGRT
jgi:molybdopterin biosynthesis enzyme